MDEYYGQTNTNIGRKAEKMRRYRANVKHDTNRYERVKEKDRERKRRQRLKLKNEIKQDKELHEANKMKRRLEQRKHRAAKKAKIIKENAKKERATGTRKSDDTEDTTLWALQKKAAIMRTQAWRLKIKLKQKALKESKSPFASKSSEYRAAKKVRESLPKTPEKRAHLVRKIALSPRVSQILNTSGQTVKETEKVKRHFEMSQAVVEGVTECLKETKPKGGQPKSEKQAYDTLKHVILKTVSKRYRVQRNLLSNMHLNKNAKHDKNRNMVGNKTKEKKKRLSKRYSEARCCKLFPV